MHTAGAFSKVTQIFFLMIHCKILSLQNSLEEVQAQHFFLTLSRDINI